jgi:hypothetical protein
MNPKTFSQEESQCFFQTNNFSGKNFLLLGIFPSRIRVTENWRNVDEKKSRPIQAIKVKQDDNKLETAQASALVFFYEKQ